MEPADLGSVEMWNNPEDGRWIYTKTMRVANFMWQIWKRGLLGLLLLSSLPILLPVLLLAFGVGFIFLLPFLPGVAVYFVLSRRFPALRISGWYRYLTSYTPGFITPADTGVLEEDDIQPIVYEDDNIQPEELQETSDDGSQDFEEDTVSDTRIKPNVEGGEGNVLQEASELGRVPSFQPSPVEGVANAVQGDEEQSLYPEQHDIRSIEDEAREGMDHEMGPETQGLYPVEVLSSENRTDRSSPQEYAAADVSSEHSIPVADFQRPFGGHEVIQEQGKEDADLSLPVDDVGDELASSEGNQGDEGKAHPQEEPSAKAGLPPQFEQSLPSEQQQEGLDGEEKQKILTEESLAEAVPASDNFPPLEESSVSGQHEEELDGMHANQEVEKDVVIGEDSPVAAVKGFDPLSFGQLLPSRLQQGELDDKDADEEEDKTVLTGEASPAEDAALDSDIPSLLEESLPSRHDLPEELDGKDVEGEGEKSLKGDASPAETVPSSDLPSPSEELFPSRLCQKELEGKDVEEEEEDKALTGEASPAEAISGFDLPSSSDQLLPSRSRQEELDGKDVDEVEEKDLTGEASPAESISGSDLPSASDQLLPSRPHQEELDGKDVDEVEEKDLTGEASPAEAISGSDLPSASDQLLPSRPHQEELDGKYVDEVEEKGPTKEASPLEAIAGSDLLLSSEQLLPSRQQHEEHDSKDDEEEEEKQEKALTGEASPVEAALDSDIPSPSEVSLLSRAEHQEELDGQDVDEEKQEKLLTGEASPDEAVSGSDLLLSSEQLLPPRQQHEEHDSKDDEEEEEKQEKALTGEASPVEAALDSDIPSPSEESLSSRAEHQKEPDDKDVGEVDEENALTGEASPAEKAAADSDIPSPFEDQLQLRPEQDEIDANDADELEVEKGFTGVASPAEAVSGSDLPIPSKESLPSKHSQEAVDGIVADVEDEEKALSGEESLGEEVSRTNLPTKKLLQEEEIDGKGADKKEEKDITGEESVVEAGLDSDMPIPSEESSPPAQHQYAEELDGKDADEEDEKKVSTEEASPAEALSPFDVVSDALPSKSEDSEAGEVTKEQKSIGELEPSAEEYPIYESPSEYDSTQEEEEGGRLEGTVATNLSADHSLVQGESHKQTRADVEEPAQDIFHEFESEGESESEDYFLSPEVSISEGFLEEVLGSTDLAHLQPPGEQDEQVPDLEIEPAEQEEGNFLAEPSSAAETTSEELASPNHGQSDDSVLDKEEGVEKSTVADSASEKPWPAGVHNEIDISKPDEEDDKMTFKPQPAYQELAGPDSTPPEENQEQLDINVATSKDELDNLKDNERKSESEDISLTNVPLEDLTRHNDIGFASEHPLLSENEDKELIKNEPSQEESQEGNIEAKDSAGYNFGTGEEEKNKAVTHINGEGELAENNVHVEEPKSTNDISFNLDAEYPTTFPVSEQTSDSGATIEYPTECDKKHEPGVFPEDAQKDTQPEVAQELMTPEEEEFNTAHCMEQQDNKSPSPNPPDIVEQTREESTPGGGSSLSGLAKESRLQSGNLPELEIDDDESLNETQIPGGMLLSEQEQRQNVKSSSESTSNMSKEPTSPSKTTTSRDQGFAEGPQPGPLSPQSAPISTVTEGDDSQDSPSQESSHVADSPRLEDKTLEESAAADQHEVHVKERNQEAEKVPSSQGSNVAGDMKVLSDEKNEESNPSGEPTLLPQRRLSFSNVGDEVPAANLGVPFLEEHNKDCQPDHKELSVNTSEFVWPSEPEGHGLNGITQGETENEESVADNYPRTTRSEETIPAQKPGSPDAVSEHPTLLSSDSPDHPKNCQSSCRKRREDESRPDGVSPTESSLESPASEANAATSTPPFEFFTPSPSQQQKPRTVGRRLSFSKHNRSMNRRSAPELVRSQTWAADSASSPPHDASREFKKAKYVDQPDDKEPMTRTSSASRAQGTEAFEGEFGDLLQYWKERDKATKSPDVSPNCTPPLIPSGEVLRRVREEISTIKRIVGQDIPPQDSVLEDVKSLCQIVGIQLPDMGDVSDLAKAMQGLELLKAVVGVTWDEHVI